jgi:hypothetical protein
VSNAREQGVEFVHLLTDVVNRTGRDERGSALQKAGAILV